jgi:hypothetical protein
MSKLLLSRHSSHPDLSPRDLDQWYQSRYALHRNKGLKHVAGSNICNNHQPPFGTIRIHFRAIHCKHHSWSTGTTGIFFFTLGSSFTITRRTIHGFTTSIHGFTTWIHYIHWSATFSTNLQGVHAAHGGSTTSTTTHAALQTLGILCGPLHSANFKEVLRPLHNISEALPYLIGNISSISQMGISRNLIWLPGLRDIID